MSDLEPYLEDGDGVIDVGANRGDYATRYAKKVGASGRVLAVEPDFRTMSYGRTQTAPYPQIEWIQVAVGDRSDYVPLHRDKESARNSLWVPNLLDDAQDFVTVAMLTLDSLALGVPNLKGIKIDAQGSEMLILKGATRCLANRNLVWYMELWPLGLTNAGSSVDQVIDYLETRGWVPVERTWKYFRDHAPSQGGHSAMDVLFHHPG